MSDNLSQSTPYPILQQYNHTNDFVTPLIQKDELGEIRGSGTFNPAPFYTQTTDRGHAFSNLYGNNEYNVPPRDKRSTNYLNDMYVPNKGELFLNPSGAVELKNSWDKNKNNDIFSYNGDDYTYYDEYQRWALTTSRKTDPILQPYLFSKLNVKFIQDSVKDYVKKYRNIEINTEQDINGLLNLMMSNYLLAWTGGGIYTNNMFAITPNSPTPNSSEMISILGQLNKHIIEQYLKSVLSGLNMYDTYINDISTLPVPLTRPVPTDMKGSRVLAFKGFFEDNHAFTNNVDSFNLRNTLPGKINSTNFGN